MIYNIDFLIAAIVILLLILWYFLGKKRAEDLNNQVFLFLASWMSLQSFSVPTVLLRRKAVLE